MRYGYCKLIRLALSVLMLCSSVQAQTFINHEYNAQALEHRKQEAHREAARVSDQNIAELRRRAVMGSASNTADSSGVPVSASRTDEAQSVVESIGPTSPQADGRPQRQSRTRSTTSIAAKSASDPRAVGEPTQHHELLAMASPTAPADLPSPYESATSFPSEGSEEVIAPALVAAAEETTAPPAPSVERTVALSDWKLFISAFGGPLEPSGAAALPQFDLDRDGDVDLADASSLLSTSLANSGVNPVANAGGPYEATQAERMNGGWTFTFDGSGSTPGNGGSPIERWVWDLGADTFDGPVINSFKWDSFGALQHDAVLLTGQGRQWGNRLVSRETITRAEGAAIEATITPSESDGYGIWGFARSSVAYSDNDVEYGVYLFGGELRVVEQGGIRSTGVPYTSGVDYRFRIELADAAGADIYYRETGAPNWILLYQSIVGIETDFHYGMLAYEGSFGIDDVQVYRGGQLIDAMVYAGVNVSLTVMDSLGGSSTDTVPITIVGDPFVASAGGVYALDALDRTGTDWSVQFDAGATTSSNEILSTVWDRGKESFAGTWIDKEQWDVSRAAQNGRMEVAGVGAWTAYVSEKQPVSRSDGLSLDCLISPRQINGRALVGFRRPIGFDPSAFVHGLYFFQDGYIYLVENGVQTKVLRPYEQNRTYEVRIEPKSGAGAEYLLREQGAASWDVVAETGDASDISLHRALSVHSGRFFLDDFQLTFAGSVVDRPVSKGGSIEVSVVDASGAVANDATVIQISPTSPVADAGGPYITPEPTGTLTGLPLVFDASHSVEGPYISLFEWALESESFDGYRLDERVWDSERAVQQDLLRLQGNGSWGGAYAFERVPVARSLGQQVQVEIRASGYGVVGFTDAGAGTTKDDVLYGLYVALDELRAIDQGAEITNLGTLQAGEWYEARIVLEPTAGATYWARKRSDTEWQLVYVSDEGAQSQLRRGVTVFNGTVEVDHWSKSLAGATAETEVVGAGDVQLSVTDAANQTSSDSTTYEIDGEPPQAVVGSAMLLMGSAYTGSGWDIALDGTASTDDFGIVQYLWEPDPDPFDGLRLDVGTWSTANTEQANRLIITGNDTWGGAYAFHVTPIDRARGAYVQARIASSGGESAFGMRDVAAANYSLNSLAYGLDFGEDGRIRIVESGNDRGRWGSYDSDTDYDVRIEMKPLGGARYLIRKTGDTTWTPLYESGYSTVASLQGGATVRTGFLEVDDLQRTVLGDDVSYRVRGDGHVVLTVMDQAFQTSSAALTLLLEGNLPQANPGGPYRAPLGSYGVFDASGTTSDVPIDQYEWDFGDGTVGAGNPVSHRYDHQGTFDVTVRVTDVGGRSSTDSTTITVEPMVVAVPWEFDNNSGIEIPHGTWDGREMTLKGTVFTDTPPAQLTYTWDFGDGTPSTSGDVVDPRIIEAAHTYFGFEGALFTATLTVHDPVYGDLTDRYPVEIRAKDLPVEVNAAIDEGLWFLHRIQDASGAWIPTPNYSTYRAGLTGSAVQAMEINRHAPPRSVADDPLVEDVLRGFESIFSRLVTQNIGLQNGHDPDSNGNGVGISVGGGGQPIYQGGMVMDAIAASGHPQMRSTTGPTGVIGLSFYDIVQDMIDQFSWGQADNGGWRYNWNANADNSAAQWAAIGMLGAQKAFGLDAPQWVKDTNEQWLTYTQTRSSDANTGRFGYTGPDNGGCDAFGATTPSGMVQLAWLGVDTTDPRWREAEDWIASRWDSWRVRENVYAFYAFAKSMFLSIPAPTEVLSLINLNWQQDDTNGLVRFIVNNQNTDGGWSQSNAGCGINLGREFPTAWQLIILTGTLFTQLPEANAGENVVWACKLPLLFDGCASVHRDRARRIETYEWDFDGDGNYDSIGTNCSVEFTYDTCPAPGAPIVYNAALRVTDDIGQTDVDTREVTIAYPPFQPVANAGGPYTAYVGIPFSPDGSGSFDIDPGDYITLQEWDFDVGDSDGTDFDHPDATAVCDAFLGCENVEWTYDSVGEVNIALRVWDSGVLNPPGCVQTEDCIPLASEPDSATVVVRQNRAPVAQLPGSALVGECEPYQLDASASFDPDGNPLFFYWDFDDDGMFDDATGVAPEFVSTVEGVFPIRVLVTDRGLQDTAEMLITVVDLAPTVTVSGPVELAVGESGCFDAAAISPCDAIIATEWDWDYQVPPGFAPSGDTGIGACHVFDEFGSYDVAVRVTDADGDRALATIRVDVQPDIARVRPAENLIEVLYQRQGYLPDVNQRFASVSLRNKGTSDVRTPIVLAFDQLTPVGSSLVHEDGFLPGSGLAYIDFSATMGDGVLSPSEQTSSIAVHWQIVGDAEMFSFNDIPMAFNASPQFVSTPVRVATEGVPYRYWAQAVDPDGDEVGYELVTGPAGMAISGSTGLVKWTPGQMDAGNVDVTLRASDGISGGAAVQSFTIDVAAVDAPPTFLSVPSTIANAGGQWCYAVDVVDPDGQPVTLDLITGPSGMVLDAANLLCWTAQQGQFYVKLVASDATHLATQDFFLTGVACNGNRVIIESNPVLAGREGEPYTYQMMTNRPDVVFAAPVRPNGMELDTVTGLVTWTPDQQQGGPRVVKLQAIDAADSLCRDEQVFEIQVEPVNVAPVFTSTPPLGATEGSLYQYDAKASDPDGDIVVYGVIGGPPGLNVDADTGVVRWDVGQQAAGQNPGGADVVLSACDPAGACRTQGFTLAITEINTPPRFVSFPKTGAVEGEAYAYAPEVVDDDGDVITLALLEAPVDPDLNEMFLDGNVLRWNPSQVAARNNPYEVRVQATDGTFTIEQVFEVFVTAVNVAPVVDPVADQFVREGDVLTLQLQASDEDRDPLRFVRTSAQPSGLAVHPTIGSIEWRIGCDEAGVYDVTIDVLDGHPNGTTTVAFRIDVAPNNCGPVITSSSPTEVAVGQPFVYQIEAYDPEGMPISCAVDSGPAGMSVDSNCQVTWTPQTLGDQSVRFVVSDDQPRDCSTLESWCEEATVSVAPCLDPPQIVSIPSATASVDNLYAYQIVGSYGEPEQPQFELINGPAGMSVDAAGLVTWTPDATQIGMQAATVAVSTGLAECRDQQTIDAEVIACTDPPVITSSAVTSIDESADYAYDVVANAGQPTDALTYSLADAPQGMSIDASTGAIRWQPTRPDVGLHPVRVLVHADRSDCRAEQAFVVEVNRVELPPMLAANCSSVAYVGAPYSCDVDANDPNGDVIEFSLVRSVTDPVMPPRGMTIDLQTGLISWLPSVADVGVARVGVVVSEKDGPGSDQTLFDLEVVENAAPSFTSMPPATAVVDAPYHYEVMANDPDSDVLTFELADAPPAMTIEAKSGLVTWTPTVADLGDHTVAIYVQDGHGGDAEQDYVVTVVDAGTNIDPVFTSSPLTIAAPDCPYEYQAVVADANGDAYECELTQAPVGMLVDPSTCAVSWVPGASQIGSHDVELVARETATSEGLTASQAFTVVVEANEAPQFRSTPVTGATVGAQYLYQAMALDADGDPVQYSLNAASTSMRVNPNTGLLTWSPTIDDLSAGETETVFDIELQAADAKCGESVQAYRIYLRTDTDAPIITLDAPVGFKPPDQTFPITVSATDNVGVTSLTLTVDGNDVPVLPDGTAYYQSTGPGLYTIVATATDAAGNMAQETAQTLAIGLDVSVPPVVQIIDPPDGATITAPTDIIGTIQHQNLAYWKLSYRPAGAGDDEWTELARSESEVPSPAPLAHFDPTVLSNGLYQMQVYSIDQAGTFYEGNFTYLVDGNMKVGNFTVSYTDLSIPVSGIPIEIKRTYDSTNKQMGDFGVGWTLDTTSVRIEEGTPLHEGWQQNILFGPFGMPIIAVIPTKAHIVNVSWPGGKTQPFLMKPPDRILTPFDILAGIEFALEPLIGTSELTTDMDTLRFAPYGDYLGQSAFSGHAGEPYDPSQYELTTADGMQYGFAGTGQRAELQSMSDRNGNHLDITKDGIFHSSGTSVLFERDDLGRITSITDPNGHVRRYEYDDHGDLVVAYDASDNATRFAYNREHGLLETTDPLGRRGIRNEYDDDGRLVTTVDANGNRIDYNRDIDARQEVLVDRLSNPTVNYYDERGNVILNVNAEGIQTEFEYDDRDNKIRETILPGTDCDGREMLYTYNDDDFLISEGRCNGGVTTYLRDDKGHPIQKTDPEGYTWSYAYDANGNLLTEQAPDGGITRYTYDSAGHRLSTTNPPGDTEYFEYDSAGRKSAHVDFAGARVEYSYDDAGNRLSETRHRTLSDGSTETIVTRWVYDEQNRVVQVIDPYGATTRTEYNANGQKIAQVDPLGRRTEYRYDATGQLYRTDYPDGTFEEYMFDAEGRRVAAVDRNGQESRYEFDRIGRPLKTIYPDNTPADWLDNPFTETAYDCMGRMTLRWDERRNQTTYDYPDCSTQIIADAAGHITRHEFDLNNRRVLSVDALLRETRYEYDEMGRRTKTDFQDGTSEEIQYDLAGRKSLEIDQGGKVTRYEHDPMGRLTAVILSSGGQDQRTGYSYDELGNQITQTDANGRTTRFEYDAVSRMTKRILPLGQFETTAYDQAGQVTFKTDFNGDTIAYEYDANGHVSLESWADGTVVDYESEPSGNHLLERITEPFLGGPPVVKETTKSYDERNRLVGVLNPDGSSLTYGYDGAGNRTYLATTTTDTGTQVTTFEFDELNRLWKVHDPVGGTTTYTYDDVGNRQSMTMPNGVVTTYGYDHLNRLTLLTNKRADDSTISRFAYTLGPAGNRLRVDETTPSGDQRVIEYAYDEIYRLTEETIDEPAGSTHPDQVITYRYDAVGNRLSKAVSQMSSVNTTTYAYDDNDRLNIERKIDDDLSGSGPVESALRMYGYDNNGNTVTRSLYATRDLYSYDAKNRLVGANVRTEGASNITFKYDTDGVRVGKTVAGTASTSFLVDKNRRYSQVLVEESTPTTPGPVETATYVFGDDLLSMTRGSSGTSYYAYDGQMSTRQLVDDSGVVSDIYAYDAFGVQLFATGTMSNVYRYTGEQYDPNLGFYYLRARYFAQSLGRFWTMDPDMGSQFDPASLHKYLYAQASPIALADPSGTLSAAMEAIIIRFTLCLFVLLTMVAYALIIYAAIKSFLPGNTISELVLCILWAVLLTLVIYATFLLCWSADAAQAFLSPLAAASAGGALLSSLLGCLNLPSFIKI